MAVAQEKVKLRQGFKVEIDNNDVPFLRMVSGGGMIIPQVDVTTSASKQQEHSTGRCSYEPLRINFSNAKAHIQLLQKISAYYHDPMNSPRSTIALTEIVRDAKTMGHAVTFYECFCSKLRLPTGNNQDGVLQTETEWSLHRAEHKAGGIS